LPQGYVVDASVALKWLIDEEDSEQALSLTEHRLQAPSLIRIEIANALRSISARGRITADQAPGFMTLLQNAPLEIVEPDAALEARMLDLALRLNHPVYDCLYLALAERTGQTLITADRRFLKALEGTGLDRLALPLDALA